MKTKYIILFITFLSFNCIGQNSNAPYWKALGVAHKFYDNADYKEAATAYSKAFKLNSEEDYASHRLFAAASNCMIDNENGVKTNLFALLPISTKRDMKKVLVNYKIFDKYKETDWWKSLESKMGERLKSLIAHHKNLKIFKKGRNLVYKATRVNVKGDTLANTFITIKPDGTGWGDEAASLQSQVIYEYAYSRQDSMDHIEELEEIVTTKFWLKRDTTGVIENENKIWMHPIRNNEFFKTELAPFPLVIFPISKETIKTEKAKIMILRNWGTYSGSETENEYNYLGEELRAYGSIGKLPCHKFQAQGFNNFHGISEIEYFFQEDIGFVEMNYLTYDQDKINFVLEKIIEE